MKISLVGYMASGKTLIGEKLAHRLNIPFIDLDKEIEKSTGQLISELMPIKNGLYFRKLEREQLLRVLQLSEFVLSCGGGTPCYYNNMEEINAQSKSFYLQETPKILAERLLSSKQNRPLVKNIADGDIFEFVAKHVFERQSFYQSAHYLIKDGDKLEQIVEILKKD